MRKMRLKETKPFTKVTQLLNGENRIKATTWLMPMPTVLTTLPHPLKWENGDLVRQDANFDSTTKTQDHTLKRQGSHIYSNPDL